MKRLTIISILILLAFPAIAPASSFNITDRISNAKFILEKKMKEKEFNLFIERLGVRESNNKWWITNSVGCIGKWQFSPSTLASLGYKHITTRKFINDISIFPEELQKKVLVALINVNEIILGKYIDSCAGKIISGIVITKSGVIAAAHLGGPMSVKMFLRSGGKINRGDIYGATIKDYMFLFAGFNI